MSIGVVSQPGDDPNKFEFITPDDVSIKTGEFVYYTRSVRVATDDGGSTEERKRIFARVTGRSQYQGLPDDFMADPNVPPESVATKMGLETADVDLYRITATIIGYFDERMGDFTNPRIVPQPGTPIKLATDEDLERYLTEVQAGDLGSAFVGDLLHRDPGAVGIHLPIDRFTSTHLSILASTGSGKSFTASVLIEEMMQPDSRGSLLIVDPHGEYSSLQEMREAEHADVFTEGPYEPEVDIVRPDNIQIGISELTKSDLFSVIDDPSDAQEHVLSDAWDRLRGDTHISVGLLKSECKDVAGDERQSTAQALDWRIDKALDRDIFGESPSLDLGSLLSPGKATVLQLDSMGLRDQQMLLSVLLRKINRSRVEYEKSGEGELDFPVFVLLEEGHRFAPAEGDARSLGILGTILSEGRKFGVGVGIISQRPSKIDDDVLSQCKTQIIMQIQNPLDQDAVRRGVEDVGEDLLAELPGLTPGQAIIAGDSVNTPFLARIRDRFTQHKAESLEASKLWRDRWEERAKREISGTVPADQDEGVEDRDSLL